MVALSTTLGLVLMAASALAFSGSTFHPQCTDACLGDSNGNLLITRCQIGWFEPDAKYVWTQLDLNTILGYQDDKIVFQKNGNYAGDNGCVNCFLTDRTMYCDCPGGLTTFKFYDMMDEYGFMCYANADFGPVCATETELRC
ncbi:hypothetical protein SBRCBS47491_008030 [Sporothrix bragantina]|uniref:Cyanovirin-N domain-containing protein n=1 Tax=Sporothrix bragantina TaxID=671064 RepID=A0ABP0CIL6_9PEZI